MALYMQTQKLYNGNKVPDVLWSRQTMCT